MKAQIEAIEKLTINKVQHNGYIQFLLISSLMGRLQICERKIA
jgi:hypothetical protein